MISQSAEACETHVFAPITPSGQRRVSARHARGGAILFFDAAAASCRIALDFRHSIAKEEIG
jgi:hypothetical protein